MFQSNDSPEGHPAPDPVLLVTKSISVFQKRHGFNIVAAAGPHDNSDYFASDLSIQAEEEFLARREKALSFSCPDPVGLDIIIGS